MKRHILKYLSIVAACFLLLLLYCTSKFHFEDRYAYVIYSDNKIINAQVSDDHQWRIKCEGKLPDKLATTLKLFEDQYFDYHFGINPLSIAKAIRDNFKAGKTVRGGSTITMQLARIHEGNRPRTYSQKLKEMVLAMAVELKYSKEEILQLYAQHAPYGGNTVGYCAAALRYYNKPAEALSWTEAATLSVLPNAPSKIYPGKAQQQLIRKRNFLLSKLLQNAIIDSVSYRLASLEGLPTQSHNFESLTPHLLQDAKKRAPKQFNYHSTIDLTLQQNVNRISQQYRDSYANTSGIENISSLILRNDGTIAAYVGNMACKSNCAADVDILRSARSPGSTLKPFLYSVALDAGLITQQGLLEDIPVFYNGYTPSNYDKKHRGIVSAERALTESLNIPAVNLLKDYGVHAFWDDLQELSFNTIYKEPDHYGLSLILGGCEVTPLELATAYMNMARIAKGEKPSTIKYFPNEKSSIGNNYPLSRGAAYLTLEMMKGVNRPNSEGGWKFFEDQKEISWKTGTSFGFRDAWSVGCSAEYTVLVWVGNADGEGRPGLTGIKKAAPILFDLFKLLPSNKPIALPYKSLDTKYFCKTSGLLPTEACQVVASQYHPKTTQPLPRCTYHKLLALDKTETMQVYHHCEEEVVNKATFALEPIVNSYYKKFTGISRALPPFKANCRKANESLQIIYPTAESEILIPKDLDEQKQSLVGKVVASDGIDSIYWFVDHELFGVTKTQHKVEMDLEPGMHTLTVVGSNGEERTNAFKVIE